MEKRPLDEVRKEIKKEIIKAILVCRKSLVKLKRRYKLELNIETIEGNSFSGVTKTKKEITRWFIIAGSISMILTSNLFCALIVSAIFVLLDMFISEKIDELKVCSCSSKNNTVVK